jgi:peptidoglycan/LPS O-acetylase OafA/YrhL
VNLSTPPAPHPRQGHAPSPKNADIEALRAIAVALVLVGHLGALLKAPGTLHSMLRFFDYWGGVDIFFAVSGFVIAGSLLRAGTPNSFSELSVPFYVRRIFRIWPAAFLWLAIAVLAAKFTNASGSFGHVRADLRDAGAAITHVYNIYRSLCDSGRHGQCGNETIYWSLSLEEQFYVLFPFLLYFIGPARLRWLLGVLILIQLPLHRQAPDMLWYLRTDAISYGVLIAIAADRGALRRVWAAVDKHPLCARWLAVLLVALVALLSLADEISINVALIALASAGLVLLASGNSDVIVPRGRLRSAFLWAGSRSFGLYLVHSPCYWGAREIFHRIHHGAPFDNSFALAATAAGLLILTAEISYRFVETPLREFGHHRAKRAAHISLTPPALPELLTVRIPD